MNFVLVDSLPPPKTRGHALPQFVRLSGSLCSQKLAPTEKLRTEFGDIFGRVGLVTKKGSFPFRRISIRRISSRRISSRRISNHDSLQVFSSAKFHIKFKHNFRFTDVLTGLLRVLPNSCS